MIEMFKRIWNHFKPIRMATVGKKKLSVDGSMEKLEQLYVLVGM